MNKEYKKTITVCNSPVIDVNLSLKVYGNKLRFSASGVVWNKKHTDYIQCGQCLDDIWEDYSKELTDPTQYKQILRLWKKWHLNDLNAECEHQESRGENWNNNPSAICPDCNWQLGHGWSYRPIEKKDLITIIYLMDIDLMEGYMLHRLVK